MEEGVERIVADYGPHGEPVPRQIIDTVTVGCPDCYGTGHRAIKATEVPEADTRDEIMRLEALLDGVGLCREHFPTVERGWIPCFKCAEEANFARRRAVEEDNARLREADRLLLVWWGEDGWAREHADYAIATKAHLQARGLLDETGRMTVTGRAALSASQPVPKEANRG